MIELPPAIKRSLPDEAAERLYHAIITGQFKQGQRIDEAQVANLLRISRGPVREALAGLAERRLVVKIPNRGTFVIAFDLEDISEICTLRAALEQFAVQRIVQRPNPISLDEMAQLVEEMMPASKSEEAELLISELDLRFHAALIAAANHKRLFDAWNNLRPQIQMLLYSRNILNEDFRELAVKGHRAILEVLRTRDAERAHELLQTHLNFSHERICEAYHAKPALSSAL
jgi:DNA-binding GntR family transcriptional regulator